MILEIKAYKINHLLSFIYYNILDAAKCSDIREADTEKCIKSWLRYASDRHGGRKRRAEKKKVSCYIS